MPRDALLFFGLSVSTGTEDTIRYNDIHPDSESRYVCNAFDRDISTDLDRVIGGFSSHELEIGSGNGKFLVEHAMKRPEVLFLGIEYSRKCINKSVSKAAKRGLANILFIHGEAMRSITEYLAGKYRFSNVYLNFPDPWPKTKHERRRIVTALFVGAVNSILTRNGSFYLVTDDMHYAEEIMSPVMETSTVFENALPSPWVHSLPGYQPTLYEEKMRKAGKNIYYLHYRRRV